MFAHANGPKTYYKIERDITINDIIRQETYGADIIGGIEDGGYICPGYYNSLTMPK